MGQAAGGFDEHDSGFIPRWRCFHPDLDVFPRAGRWRPLMSEENVEIVRKAHEAFYGPDLDAFDLEVFYRYASPDLVVDWSRSHGLEAGIYCGEAETRRFWATFAEAFDKVVAEPLEFIDRGESIVVPHHLRASGRSGIQVEAYSALIFTIRDGLIVELRLYRETNEALEALDLER
jgi:ketosteroid isomerase-like protein